MNYYKIKFQLVTSLNIGSGENQITDKDIIRNSKGDPYIPGTALAGVYRSIFSEDDGDKYFGFIRINTSVKENNKKTPPAKASLIKVYDANITGSYVITKRDCVALDEFKTAIEGSKFDFEVLESDAEFETYIETEAEAVTVAETILSYWNTNGFSFGSKTMRGLGKTKLIEVKEAKFQLPDDKEKWLDFDMYEEAGWSSYTPKAFQKEDTVQLELSLTQNGGISIRKYTTTVRKNKDDLVPDYQQLTLSNGNPVIPGTSWAGAFRHNMINLDLQSKDAVNIMFGKKKDGNSENEKAEYSKSKIYFSETEIQGSKSKIMSHNAIDRFTNGVKDSALFTEKFYYGGTASLTITLPANTSVTLKKLLAASIMDLHNGFLAIGGQTAIGRGMFTVKLIDKDVTYEALLMEMGCNA